MGILRKRRTRISIEDSPTNDLSEQNYPVCRAAFCAEEDGTTLVSGIFA